MQGLFIILHLNAASYIPTSCYLNKKYMKLHFSQSVLISQCMYRECNYFFHALSQSISAINMVIDSHLIFLVCSIQSSQSKFCPPYLFSILSVIWRKVRSLLSAIQ